MPASGRQGGVQRKKLPPLIFAGCRVDAGPVGHLATHPGPLALGVAAGFLLGGGDVSIADGRLADLAPTLLALMGLPQPKEMTGVSLLRGNSS
jgi:hypothetical protein